MTRTYVSKYTTDEAMSKYLKRQNKEVAANSKVFFDDLLPQLLKEHRNKYALMRHKQVVEIYKDFDAAYRAGNEQFDDCIFSVQRISDEPLRVGSL